jgi:hypothetical protein
VEIARAKANSDSATDRTVPSGGTYSYRVRAYNATGVSPYSNTVTVRK